MNNIIKFADHILFEIDDKISYPDNHKERKAFRVL